MTRSFFAVFMAIVFVCCHNPTPRIVSEEDFPNIAKLNGEELFFDGNRYDEFYIIDSILLAFNASAKNAFIDAYSLPSLDHLGVVARQGRGPGEFLFAEYADNNFFYENGELNILIFDELRNLACIRNVTRTLERQRPIVDKEVEFTKPISVLGLVDSKTLLVKDDVFRGNCAYRYDMDKGSYRQLGVISDGGSSETDMERLWVNSSIVRLFPDDKSKALIHHRKMNRTSVVALSERGVALSEGPISIFIESLRPEQLVYRDVSKTIYNDIYISGNDVYCLYMNQTEEEIFDAPLPVEIHLFDRRLTPSARFLVEEHIRFFAVDRLQKTIYGITPDDRYYRYRLP